MKMPKVFLDSSNPEDTRKAKQLLGFLDGQTTNPSLVAKNPKVVEKVKGGKIKLDDLLSMYKEIVQEIGSEVKESVSVEVYADWDTNAEEMLMQAENMKGWHEKVYIKFPTIPEGLKAAHEFVKQGGKVNMTLVFDQPQAAAVYVATLAAKSSSYVSPFIGRWDDRGYNGLDLVKNIKTMYNGFDQKRGVTKSHVEILAASIRTKQHLDGSIVLGADILTLPLKTIEDWVNSGKKIPDEQVKTDSADLKPLTFQPIQLEESYERYQINKDEGGLLDAGLKKFASDWNSLIDS